MTKIETWELVKKVLSTIDDEIKIKSIAQLSPGIYQVFSCSTKWAFVGMTVEIGLYKYKVKEVDANTSITITGDILPAGLSFFLPPFFPVHGTILATNEELSLQKSVKNKLPMVYLHEITEEEYNEDPTSAIDRTSDCDIYFLTESNREDWTTEQHYTRAIRPMRNLMFMFIEALKNSDNVGLIGKYKVYDHARFGTYVSSKGHTSSIFNDNTSGTQLRISIQFKKESECECEGIEESDLLQKYDFCNTGVYDRLLPHQLSCLSTQLNTPVLLRNSNDTYTESVSAADNPKTLNDTVVTQSNGATELIPYSLPVICQPVIQYPIAYNRPLRTNQLLSYQTGDDGWHYLNGTYTYAVIGLKPQLHPTDYSKLSTLNAFGNYARWTNEAGAYFNQRSQTAYTNGDLKNASGVAIPANSLGAARGLFGVYAIDHYTGLGWKVEANDPANFATAVTNSAASNYNSLTGWRLTNINELSGIESPDFYLTVSIISALPFNSPANGLISSSTPVNDSLSCTVITGTEHLSFSKLGSRYYFQCRNHY